MVDKVRAAVNIRFQGQPSKPDTIFTDRGKGFYVPSTGRITNDYKEALRKHGLQAIMGNDARAQPGKLQEILLHETAVAWLRVRLAESTPAKCWLETREQFRARLKHCCEAINEAYEVENLCRAFLTRVRKLKDKSGGRLGE